MNDLTLWLTAVFLLGVLIGAVTVMGIEIINHNRYFGGTDGNDEC